MKKGAKYVYAFLIFMFLYIPIMVLIAFSFNKSKLNVMWTGFTFDWYKSLFSNVGILEAVKNSFEVAVISTIISVIIGTLAAIGLYRYNFKGKKLLDTVLYLPLVIPEIVMGISLLAFFSLINVPLGKISLVIAHVTFSIAYVIAVVKTRLDGFDKSVEEAAMDLGANPFKTLIYVTLPIIMPGVIAGGLLAFTLSLDDVIISFFVSGPNSTTLPLKVFSMVKFGVTPEINALSTIILIFTVIILILSAKLTKIHLTMKRVGIILITMFILVGSLGYGIFGMTKVQAKTQEELNVFNWSEYLPPEVIEKFEKTYNIKVNYSTFSSNEEMLAKLMAGGGDYDIAVASDFMVEILKKQELIQEINKNDISNMSNLSEDFLNLPFDKGNNYSIPYMWLAGIIGYDKTKVKLGEITGYADLWKSDFKNSITLLDDERVIIGITLKKLGYSINETDPIALEKAREELKKLQTNVKSYDSDSPKTSLINGESKIIFAWGAEASLAKRENKNIEYVIPKEGLFLQQDNFVIPKGAKNTKAAEKFIDFILQPEISAEISKKFPYGNPNKEAYKYIDKKIMEDKAVYPDNIYLKRGEYLKDIGDKVKDFDEIWSKVKQ
ncbi:spermidine/putrescine transport system permease protein [Clostridium cavendishii DSM 21758]|uniref:Spermidine/putrescine transport system permease protein n=1 Tax=Clostridium cavendishii DSM 21758 TaxID=1121302 RepID=A0A1M6D337_9CLOT|nr:extracellular solute-binding protein [Clostridium cavendishii]SHI67599.1 spermidine/putrescine transport system permease protein [Clostridium cavendishii DSM 21758]